MMTLPKYSIGTGDRFAHQGAAQLKACIMAAELGVDVTPVWNKSYREHSIVNSIPMDTRKAADTAVAKTGWNKPYFVDADHINITNVDHFMDSSDFFTLDVAQYIGQKATNAELNDFIAEANKLCGDIKLKNIEAPIAITTELVCEVAEKYLQAIIEAAKIYAKIVIAKGAGNFVTEVSMDETAAPQTPAEMLIILFAIARAGIPAQTIAPKFSGEFYKGVDYVGDPQAFAKEFFSDVAVVEYAVKNFGLPQSLKLSVHSGSDKFSIYGHINAALKAFDAGVHLKTAGTTWLEELIGLAEAGGEGLAIAKEVYSQSFHRYDEMCAPYAAVIHIEREKLPNPEDVNKWSSNDFAAALRHIQSEPRFNIYLRQLLHVGYKVAAEMGDRYINALEKYEETISEQVTENIYERHLKPVFINK
jgi:hypothetical protein